MVYDRLTPAVRIEWLWHQQLDPRTAAGIIGYKAIIIRCLSVAVVVAKSA
jgi:hypothetical protein